MNFDVRQFFDFFDFGYRILCYLVFFFLSIGLQKSKIKPFHNIFRQTSNKKMW